MKIGFVLDDTLDKPDGVQQYVLTLGKWFSEQGHEVHYLAGSTKRTDIPHIHSLGSNISVRFNHNRLSIPWSSSKKSIKALLETEKFDVLHVQMPYSPLLAGRIIKLAPAHTAVVGTFHIIPFSSVERLGTKLLRLIQARNLRRIDSVVSVSEPAQKFAHSAMDIVSQVIPNAVDVSAFTNGKKLKKYDDGKINIVFLGRLVERKGAFQLLEAVKLLYDGDKLADIRVIICGKGPLEAKLRAFVSANKLDRCVTFEGFIEEKAKADYLASADIAVFPSTGGESFGIVLIEAMAAGSQTVLAGNNVGYASVMGKESEQLIEPNNSQAFAKMLDFFAHSKQARLNTAKWQSAHVGQFDVTNVCDQLLVVYRDAIAKRSY